MRVGPLEKAVSGGKFSVFAGNGTVSEIYPTWRKARPKTAVTLEMKLNCIDKAHQSMLKNPMAKKYRHI